MIFVPSAPAPLSAIPREETPAAKAAATEVVLIRASSVAERATFPLVVFKFTFWM